ncbi:7012_t:CDS:2, partial [Cetraspora pellucida]
MNETFELSIEDFDKQWILVNNIWTRFNEYKLDNGDEHKTFICRLSKPKESSRRKENIPSEKLCAKIRITWLATSNMIRIERVSGTPDYSYSMEETDMRKWSKFIKDMDSGVEYLKTKEVANIKQKLVGPMNSHLVEGADLQSDILTALKIIRTFAPRWNPRYMLLDQSSVESNSIALTFSGLFV